MIKFADEMTYPELEISLGKFKKPYNVGGHTDFETLKIWITSEFRKRGVWFHHILSTLGHRVNIVDVLPPFTVFHRAWKPSPNYEEAFLRSATAYLCPEGFDFPDGP